MPTRPEHESTYLKQDLGQEQGNQPWQEVRWTNIYFTNEHNTGIISAQPSCSIVVWLLISKRHFLDFSSHHRLFQQTVSYTVSQKSPLLLVGNRQWEWACSWAAWISARETSDTWPFGSAGVTAMVIHPTLSFISSMFWDNSLNHYTHNPCLENGESWF